MNLFQFCFNELVVTLIYIVIMKLTLSNKQGFH